MNTSRRHRSKHYLYKHAPLVLLSEQLVELQGKLLSVEMGPSLEVVRAIQQISRDMHMITFYLRPMKIVATQLITVRVVCDKSRIQGT